MKVILGTAEREGSTVTVSVTITGDYDRISLLITDKKYSEKGAKIKEYKALPLSDGKAVFELPDGYSSTDKVYILTEAPRAISFSQKLEEKSREDWPLCRSFFDGKILFVFRFI